MRRFFVLLAVLAGVAGQAQEGMWNASAGAKYASGDYGTADETQTLQLPLTLSYIRGGWSFAATVSYLQLQSDGNYTMSPGGLITKEAEASASKGPAKSGSSGGTMVGGLGDTLIEAGYAFFPESLPMVKLAAILKLPTADEAKGLGTGESDLSLQVSLFENLGAFSLSAFAGYMMTGDTDAVAYDDIFYGSAGAMYVLDPKWSVGASYYYAQEVLEILDPVTHLSLYLNGALSERAMLGLSYTHGLSDATADSAFGISLGLAF